MKWSSKEKREMEEEAEDAVYTSDNQELDEQYWLGVDAAYAAIANERANQEGFNRMSKVTEDDIAAAMARHQLRKLSKGTPWTTQQ